MTFQRERIADTWDEAKPLFSANHADAGVLSPEDFAPSRARYESIETVGLGRCFTGRVNGKLVAYAVFFILPHLMYPNKVFAQQDVMFVSQEYRGISGVRFIQYIDKELKADGADISFRHVSHRLDYSRTLTRLGYEPVETSFMKEL